MNQMGIKKSFSATKRACYVGYFTQAVVNNFAPLLFLTFRNSFDISLDKITSLITINFAIQLFIDLLSTKLVDKIGYRASAIAAHITAALGLAGLGILPSLMSNSYLALLISIVLYAVGGGLIEVIISPIVEACPSDKKSGSMALLHSFYCWGHVITVLLSTLFFMLFSIENWRILSIFWAIVPLVNTIFFALVPIKTPNEKHEPMSLKSLVTNKVFWVLFLLMICAGASEQGMSQWASAFAESGLHVSKAAGDLAGPCFFAAMMGISRVIYAKLSDKVNLSTVMLSGGALCIVSYLIAVISKNPLFSLLGCGMCGFSVGIMWPGTFSLACVKCPTGGTAMFALFALAGDFGCLSGPSIVGFVSNARGGSIKLGLAAAIVFPVMLIVGILILKRITERHNNLKIKQ